MGVRLFNNFSPNLFIKRQKGVPLSSTQTPQFNTSISHKDHTFSALKIPQFNTKIPQFHTKNPSVPQTPKKLLSLLT